MPIPRYRLSHLAEIDINDALDESSRLFGPLQEERYFNLFAAAAERIAEDPQRPGSKDRSALSPGLRSYHIGNAANRKGAAAHVLYYRPVTFPDGDKGVLIACVLHEPMDPELHISGDPT
jgi:toxin ParE1/3/4